MIEQFSIRYSHSKVKVGLFRHPWLLPQPAEKPYPFLAMALDCPWEELPSHPSVHAVQVELNHLQACDLCLVNDTPPFIGHSSLSSSGQIGDPDQADLNQWDSILGLLGGTLGKISPLSHRLKFSRIWTWNSPRVDKACLGKEPTQKRAEPQGKTYKHQD